MWEKYGYIISSKYRIHVVISLLKHPKTPTQISSEMKANLGHISRTLKELSKLQIVLCINPSAIKGRIYKLTIVGEQIANQIIEDNKT